MTDAVTENMKQILTENSKSGLKVAMITGDSNEMINDHHGKCLKTILERAHDYTV